jgi:protein-S-isoprenylcysteine O-methyltransferase Ste14
MFLVLKTYLYPMSTTSKILVFLQFLCLTYLVLFTNLIGQGVLLVVQISGFLLSLWAVIIMKPGKFNIQPELKRHAIFIRSGPYRLIRNPMYAGLILIFGSSTLNNHKTLDIFAFILLIGVLLLKIYSEEKYLNKTFGADYLSYKKRTYRLIPFIY